jgi:hypothetical protein
MPAVLQPNGDYHRTKSATRVRIRLFSISDNLFCDHISYYEISEKSLPNITGVAPG